MKAHYTTQNGRMSFEIDAPTAKDVFGQLASVQEVFDAESVCGMCGSSDIRFVVRESEGKKNGKTQTYTYYELRCQGVLDNGDPCRARFDFGQSLDTENLFPKRKDADGKWMDNRGWYRYVPQNGGSQGDRSQSSGPDENPWPEENYRPGNKPPDHPTATSDKPPASWATQPTPEGLQPSFDRIGDLFGKPAPTRVSSCMDLIRESMHATAKGSGTNAFDEIFRKHTGGREAIWASNAGDVKRMLADLVDKCKAMEVIR